MEVGSCVPRDFLDFQTEDLIINSKEHKLLKKFKSKLEGYYNIEIRMPKEKSLDCDLIFVSLHGLEQNRDKVKKFLSDKMNMPPQTSYKKDAILITLSDSEEESSSLHSKDESVIELSPVNSPKVERAATFCRSLDESIGIIESHVYSDISKVNRQKSQRRKRKYQKSVKDEEVNSKGALLVSDVETYELCEVTSTTEGMVPKKANLMSVIEEPTARIELPALDFIPLCGESKSKNAGKSINKCSHLEQVKTSETNNDDIIVLDDSVNQPEVPRKLRPIVIDGSNIAMEHGKVSRSYSIQGIKLAIDYFLARGHTQVTAFIPKYRRNPNPNRPVPTTNAEILDELEKKQQVVFTPSRRVNGKCISSYDDRFIVQLASSNGGVIVSNDNFRDLIDENESFKEAIEQRLLMFCFVGDMFMVPDDPLGRNGPTLLDYLSFPPDSKET